MLRIAVYNAPKSYMSTRRLARILLSFAVFLCCSLSVSAATNWSAVERDLASKIAAATGPGAVSFNATNRSSLTASEADAIAAEIRGQLNASGVRVVTPDQAAASVQVTLSENVQGYVWVAQVQQGNNAPAIIIVPAARRGPAAQVHEAAPLAIAKLPVWSQEAQMLDVGVIDSPPRVIVLEPERIVLYSRPNAGQWQKEQEFAISHMRPWPRDVRGRLVLRKDRLFDAYLLGVLCQASPGARLYVQCHESDDPWPLATEASALNAFFSPRRNFFTGVLVPGIGKETAVGAFYSAAPIPRDKYNLWLFAAVDGQIHAMDGMTDLIVPASGWGSDIATVHSSCGSGWQVLATSNSDGTRPDSVRAYQLPDRDPLPASEAVDVGGNVVSLWTEQAGNSAVAVSRNLRTGLYEAFRLAVSCGQ